MYAIIYRDDEKQFLIHETNVIISYCVNYKRNKNTFFTHYVVIAIKFLKITLFQFFHEMDNYQKYTHFLEFHELAT